MPFRQYPPIVPFLVPNPRAHKTHPLCIVNAGENDVCKTETELSLPQPTVSFFLRQRLKEISESLRLYGFPQRTFKAPSLRVCL